MPKMACFLSLELKICSNRPFEPVGASMTEPPRPTCLAHILCFCSRWRVGMCVLWRRWPLPRAEDVVADMLLRFRVFSLLFTCKGNTP